MRIYLTLITIFFAGMSYAQFPGSILESASPAVNSLDPNGDGWVTISQTAFDGPLDETEFELPFVPVPQYQPEPEDDNQYASSCSFSELVGDGSIGADEAYYYYNDPDAISDNGDEWMAFRFRVARYSSSNFASFSILMDTDNRFGFSNPGADPNALAGNPGFELEIVVYNKTGPQGGVRVYNVDGRTDATLVNFYAPNSSNYQVSYALNSDPGCSGRDPVFIDMTIPFSALGILSTHPIRMASAVSGEIHSALAGGASDVGGVDGHVIPGDDAQFVAAINNTPPVALVPPLVNVGPSTVNATLALNENSSAGTTVHQVSASDVNGDVLSYAITEGNANGAFAVNSNTGLITVSNPTALDFELTSSFILTVHVSDGSLFSDAMITINVNDVNEAPVLSGGSVALNENALASTAVFLVAGADPDAGTILNYAITAGNTGNAFTIDNESGEITVNNPAALNFETTPEFALTVRVSDGLLFDDAPLTVSLQDVNEAPVTSDAGILVDEKTVNGTMVHIVSASDPDAGASLTYSMIDGNTGGAFVIESTTGKISVANSAALDFETTPSFILTLQVSDGNLFAEAMVTVNLKNVNEPPGLADATVTIDENTANGTLIHTLSGSDPDAGSALTYSITGGNTGNAFAIGTTSGAISINHSAGLNFEVTPSIVLNVRVSDEILFKDAILTITLNDVNESPIVSNATVALDENAANGSVVHTVSATDPDAGASLNFSFVSGNMAGALTLNNSSGLITVSNTTALDFESSPSFAITVRVSDGSLFSDAVITVNLGNINEAPSLGGATVPLNENAPAGTSVYTMSAMDPDAHTVLSYTITGGNDDAAFDISTHAGVITVSNSTALDFETTSSFLLTVRVSDDHYFDEAVVIVNLNDVNEGPSVLSSTVTLDEHASIGTVVLLVNGSDPEGDGLGYAITQGNKGSAFTIDQSGALMVDNPAALDFETASSFLLTVRVSDGALFSDAAIQILLNNVNEAPEVDDQEITVHETLADNDVVGSVRATDPDEQDLLSYTFAMANDEVWFSLNASTGEISVRDAAQLNRLGGTFELYVTATDVGGLQGRGMIRISLMSAPGPNDLVPQKGFSPNGDGVNDFWFIKGIEAYPQNMIQVFNRWGLPVYEVSGYDNDSKAWRGERDEASEMESTYFFIIKAGDLKPITGYVIVKP